MDPSPAVREPERWRAAGTDTARRLDSWADILAGTHLAFEVHPTHRTPRDFRGAVTRRPIGDLMLVDCAASPFLGHRGRAVMTPETRQEDILGFQFVCRGIETVREGSRSLALTAGDVVHVGRAHADRRGDRRGVSQAHAACSPVSGCSRCARGWPNCARSRR